MKKLLVFIITTGLITSCNDNKESTTSNTADSTNLVQDTLPHLDLNNKNFTAVRPYDKPVDEALANECILNMETTFTRSTDATLKSAYTKSVSFGSKALRDWLEQYDVLEQSDSLVISFGMYTQNAVTNLSLDRRALNRITVFVWPYKFDQAGNATSLTRPFNIGSLHP
jgi:hypothetical protein